MNSNVIYATGKRKTAIARVWLKQGSGKVVVNDKDLETYFGNRQSMSTIQNPFAATKTEGLYDVSCTVKGGGVLSQSNAIAHGISKAMANTDEAFRVILKKLGLLTRDSRVVERKKPGLRKARRKPQFSKR